MATARNVCGIINTNDLYTVKAFRLRLSLTESAWRSMRDRGLPVIRVGKRAFISGRDAVAFLEACGNERQSQGSQTLPRQLGSSLDQP
jgi:hypothetical protein